jgi:Mrp family chromosome partitioning ATPase
MQSGSAVNGMRLGDYMELLRRQWLPVLICLALGIGIAVAYIQLAPREYRATTSVLVTATNPAGAATSDRTLVINLDTEAQLVTATETVGVAAKTLAVPSDEARELADRVGVSVPPNTEILDITFTGDTAAGAQRGSQAFADAYLAQRSASAQAVLASEEAALQTRIDTVDAELAEVLKAGAAQPAGSPERARSDDQAAALNSQLAALSSQQNRVRSEKETVTAGRIVTEPRLPSSPSSPDPVVALGAGLLLGLVGGVGVAARRHRKDDVIRTPEDLLQRTSLPVAAVLTQRLRDGDVSILQPLTADGRGFARLRNLVTTGLEESPRRVVLVAGARRGGGPVAANLAASLARSGEEVVLVCADVFGSTAAALLGDSPTDGLAEVLDGRQSVDGVLRRFDGIPSLRILGPGRDVDRADALLQTRSPRKLVDRLLETASYVVIEAPPTTDGPDAQTLANVAELGVLVVEAGPTTAREVLDACAQLESVGTPVLGAVIARYGRDGDPGERRRPSVVDPDEAPATRPDADEPATGTAGRPQGTVGTVPLEAVSPGAAPGLGHGDGSTRLPSASGTIGAGTPPVTSTQVIPPGSRGPAAR